MKAMEVKSPKAPLELVEKDIPEPGPDSVRVKVKACGICHSDSFTKEGLYPGIKFPRVPGHEVAGVIDALGENVKEWKVGQRVGIGWHAGHCFHCSSCRKGDFGTCQSGSQVSGISFDGGYAEYMVAPREALALIPDEINFIDAAPLMCAGVTTFNSLRNSGARAGDVVAILGVGGLGHLAVQFAVKMGFKTIAIARGKDKEALSKKLGAWMYIDSLEKKPGEELKKIGGAKIILSTITSGKAVSQVISGLDVNGKLIVVGVSPEPIEVSTLALIGPRNSIAGWPSGTSIDSQDTMNFCGMTNIRPMNEVFPLEKANEAYDRMMSGKARFRVVLSME
jgi:D-arabinose 1-dehydrogenase-like Zn-dependent alcohol dehydrogenase